MSTVQTALKHELYKLSTSTRVLLSEHISYSHQSPTDRSRLGAEQQPPGYGHVDPCVPPPLTESRVWYPLEHQDRHRAATEIPSGNIEKMEREDSDTAGGRGDRDMETEKAERETKT